MTRAVLSLIASRLVAAHVTVHLADDGDIIFMSHRELEPDASATVAVDGNSVDFVSNNHSTFESFSVPEEFDASLYLGGPLQFSAPAHCGDCLGVYYVNGNRSNIGLDEFEAALYSEASSTMSMGHTGADLFQDMFDIPNRDLVDKSSESMRHESVAPIFGGLLSNIFGGALSGLKKNYQRNISGN